MEIQKSRRQEQSPPAFIYARLAVQTTGRNGDPDTVRQLHASQLDGRTDSALAVLGAPRTRGDESLSGRGYLLIDDSYHALSSD